MQSKSVSKIVGMALFLSSSLAAAAPEYRLGVVLVVDQFRADYLMRFKDEFKKSEKGFHFLMSQGAYFPIADHGLLQNMTGPGHAAILSGAYPYRHHISVNTWFDKEKNKMQYCVQDDESLLIGSEGVLKSSFGISPRNFNANTVGDELKNADRKSRVVSISFKDRSAVLMGGKRTDHSLWFEDKTCQWVTSQFFAKELPGFAKSRNASIKKQNGEAFSFGSMKDVKKCSKESLRTPWAVEETLKLALAAVDEMKLGRSKDTDLLLVSLSNHDYLGHMYGPNHENLKEMTLAEDRATAHFLSELSRRIPGGMKDIFVVLTGDHGIPPNHLPNDRLPSENIPEDVLPRIVEETLTKEHGSPKGGKWVAGSRSYEFGIYLSTEALKGAGITASQAVKTLRPRLLKERFVDDVYSKDDVLRDRKVPAGELGVIMDRTLSERSADVLVILKPFYWSDGYPVTHMTHYSYDRYVPLIFYGKSFKPGVYRQIVRVVDIAPTLSSVLNVIPPSQSEGRVITEILR